MNELARKPCLCNGTGLLHKKVWTQPAAQQEVREGRLHPAIAASAPAYRTVVSFPCECPLGDKRRQTQD
jgi:hypothetical protein